MNLEQKEKIINVINKHCLSINELFETDYNFIIEFKKVTLLDSDVFKDISLISDKFFVCSINNKLQLEFSKL